MSCALHDTMPGYVDPCPWCAEAAGLAPRAAWTPPADACVHCESPDMRRNELATPPYRWCAACGQRANKEETQDELP